MGAQVERSPRHADAGRRQVVALALLMLALAGWIGHVAAQRMDRPASQPIAVTPPPAAPREPVQAAVPPREDLSNRKVIATTRPPAPPVQPVANWPELKTPLAPPAIRGAALALEKVSLAAEPRKSVAYEIVVRNVGAAPAHQVRVDDPLPEGARYLGGEPTAETADNWLTWKLGTLEPGAERRLRVEVQANGALDLASCGALAAFATASQTPARAGRPQLTLTVTGPEGVAVGEPVVLHMKLANTGTAPATNIILYDRLPAGLRHPAGDEVETELGTLAPGESKSFTLQAIAVQPGRHINQAAASADGAAPAAAHTPITVREPELLLEVADLNDPLPVGAETTYEIRILNPGSAALTGLRVTATLPAGLALRDADGPTAYRSEGPRVVFEPLPQLDARADLLYRVRVRGREAGEWRFAVELKCDQLAAPLCKEEGTRVSKE
jgi:uncharacterized repeat protein (TIGR01451 family)